MIAVPSPFSPSYESTQERIFPSNSPFKFPEAKHRETKERSNEWSFRPVAKAVQEAPGKKLSPSKDTPYTEIARREMKVVRAIGPNAARILWESKMIREANKNSLVKLQSKYNSEQVVAKKEKEFSLRNNSKEKIVKEQAKDIINKAYAKAL
eukprot:TRINITY_DN14317_c0_g2_i1.p2 TRINITY_DN14317_c0_g2~~TRINITY_DN14317_c0_g2_i1.p2  ORF type:complete len:164 (+),score=33.74 TRINITY_DN14317_c0_g2_i1:37-492(+)